jgi:acyl-CoA thioesterase FadM
MYPYLRSARVLLSAWLGSPLDFDGESVVHTRVWPGDIDVFGELNNGRQLTLMDMGRFDLAVRSGFLRTVHRQGWGLAVGGASVRFRHRINLFTPIRLRSRVVGHDERWFYFHQKIERDERLCSAALVRTAVIEKGRLVPVARVLEALGPSVRVPGLPDWVRAWIDAEGLRPWPASRP